MSLYCEYTLHYTIAYWVDSYQLVRVVPSLAALLDNFVYSFLSTCNQSSLVGTDYLLRGVTTIWLATFVCRESAVRSGSILSLVIVTVRLCEANKRDKNQTPPIPPAILIMAIKLDLDGSQGRWQYRGRETNFVSFRPLGDLPSITASVALEWALFV
jgi:hypothetical protein